MWTKTEKKQYYIINISLLQNKHIFLNSLKFWIFPKHFRFTLLKESSEIEGICE